MVRLKFYLICVFVFAFIAANAQDSYKLSGVVSNEKGMPIENVSVYENGTLLRNVTDVEGRFIFETDSEEPLLSFSHVSYELEAVQLHLATLEKTDDNVYHVRILLRRKTVLLPEVSVKTNVPVLAYENKEIWVVDYVVNQTGIILLSNRLKENVVLHLNWNQDTLAKQRVAKKFDSFYIDAFNHIHLLSKDSAYQLYCDNETIHLLYGTTSYDFHAMLPPVALATDSVLVLKFYQTANQELNYLLINRNTSEVSMLANLENERKKEMVQQWGRDNKRYADVTTAMYGISFNDDVRKEGYKYRALTRPIYNPIVCLADEIWLFAFENNQLMRYDKVGELLEKVPIAFHRVSNRSNVLNPNWVQEIVVDKAENRCYVQFVVNGIVTLREIDLENGTLTHEIRLDKHPFPEKIQICNNRIYYIYAERSSNFSDKKSLYQMTINN